jgi:hypothetical protein
MGARTRELVLPAVVALLGAVALAVDGGCRGNLPAGGRTAASDSMSMEAGRLAPAHVVAGARVWLWSLVRL